MYYHVSCIEILSHIIQHLSTSLNKHQQLFWDVQFWTSWSISGLAACTLVSRGQGTKGTGNWRLAVKMAPECDPSSTGVTRTYCKTLTDEDARTTKLSQDYHNVHQMSCFKYPCNEAKHHSMWMHFEVFWCWFSTQTLWLLDALRWIDDSFVALFPPVASGATPVPQNLNQCLYGTSKQFTQRVETCCNAHARDASSMSIVSILSILSIWSIWSI